MIDKGKPKMAMSRRRRNLIFALCLFFLAGLVGIDRMLPPERVLVSSQDPEPTGDHGKYHDRTCRVIYVVDGDTLDVDVRDGDSEKTRIRLWGIDTPEKGWGRRPDEHFAVEATEFVTELTLGEEVVLLLVENDTRCKYGRLLAYIQLPDGRILNEAIIEEGFGFADLRFRHPFYNKYKQLERSARRKNKGLWEDITREQLPDWLRRREPKLLAD